MALLAEQPLDAAFEVELPSAPYPGLRPFNPDEWPIFFGREQMTDEVIARVIRQHLVVVHGDSGCGKSSLVRAGVLAQLEQERARSGVRWRTAIALPREAPLRRLAEAIAGLQGAADDLDHVFQIRRILNRGADAPAALAELLRAGDDDHVCILIDQFEELFAFASQHGREEAQLFVDILVGLQQDPPPGLYAILTMRSEFLGVCARFKGLAEAVNQTQYLLPQMERPALIRAIREPAVLYDGEVSRELAERLIADAGGGQDQLPLIQHGLMLLWRHKIERLSGANGFAEASLPYRPEGGLEDVVAPPSYSHKRGPTWRLGLQDYRAGDLASLLSDHADQVLAKAAPDQRREKIAEHVFRALTDINAEGQAVRRPQTLAELMAVTGTDEQTLKGIIDRFREEGVSFLRPYGTAPLEPDNEIDISHEALIRCWQKIADPKDGWLLREFRDGLTWQSLRVQADKFAEDTEEMLSPGSTVDRDAWLATLPSEVWCRRYRGGWEPVRGLMQASRAARARQIARESWIRRGLITALAIFLALTALAGWNWWQASRARAEAQLGDSLYRAEQARKQLAAGFPVTAMQLALAGLPEDAKQLEARPWIGEAAGALVEAMGAQRELKVLRGHEGP
jgi:ABC-type dipeptide/oligopeptide/nickel transport system ATPase subunit